MATNPQENEGMGRKVPQIDFPSILARAENFHDIKESIMQQLYALKKQGVQRIGFVSGRVRENTKDWEKLAAYTKKIREESEFPIFSSTDIFQVKELWKKLPEPKLPQTEKEEKFKELFREILSGGVTDIFMTPGWDKYSLPGKLSGAEYEHKTAQDIGINIESVSVDEQISSL